MAFTLRGTKGSALTQAELDANFTNPSYGTFGSATGTTAGEVRASGNVSAYASSDRKYKENIEEIKDAISIVVSIGGKTFDWTQEYIDAHGGEDDYYMQRHDFGVIAQDVDNVFPLATRVKVDDGTLAVDYVKLVAVAFAAIKELVNEQEKIKSELADLRSKI